MKKDTSKYGGLFDKAVPKILSCWVNTTSRQGIKQLVVSFSSIFSYFPMKVAGGHFLYTDEAGN